MLKPVPSPPRLSDILKPGSSVEVAPDIAGRILLECRYQRQRPRNDEHALRLADAMVRGTFLTNTQIAFGKLNGQLFLINGQHRLTAIEISGSTHAFRIEIYPCATQHDLDERYLRFDQPGGIRSIVQLASAFNLHDDHEGGLRPPTAALLVKAMPLVMIDFKRMAVAVRPRATRDLDVKIAAAREWKPWAIEYQKALDLRSSKQAARYRQAGVFAVALATFRFQTEKARAFWGTSILNSGLDYADPRAGLHRSFLGNVARQQIELAEISAGAWNAFFKNRKLETPRPSNSIEGGEVSGRPILGTSYVIS